MSASIYKRLSVFLVLIFMSLSVQSKVIVNLGEGGGLWADAIGDGRIEAAGDPVSSNAAQAFYTEQVLANGLDGFAGVQALLSPDVPGVLDEVGTPHESLVMSWDNNPLGGPASANTLLVAAWDFGFQRPGGVDLSSGSSMIHFSLNAPPGVWDVSLELIDIFGNVRGWFLSMPPTIWTDYWISVNDLSLQGFDFFFEDPGFDIGQVAGVRFNESGLVSAVFPVNPAGGPLYWNAWDHLRIEIPLPAVWLLLLVGLIPLLRRSH